MKPPNTNDADAVILVHQLVQSAGLSLHAYNHASVDAFHAAARALREGHDPAEVARLMNTHPHDHGLAALLDLCGGAGVIAAEAPLQAATHAQDRIRDHLSAVLAEIHATLLTAPPDRTLRLLTAEILRFHNTLARRPDADETLHHATATLHPLEREALQDATLDLMKHLQDPTHPDQPPSRF